jgi:hypothetical protein
MNTQNNFDFISSLRGSDLQSLIIVLQEYQQFCQEEQIFDTGFNQYTGYVYIALENTIQIASCFGQSVDYIVTNFDTGEEYFLTSYEEALKELEKLMTESI